MNGIVGGCFEIFVIEIDEGYVNGFWIENCFLVIDVYGIRLRGFS